MTSGFWIFGARVRNIYLFWWRHFDIISDFLFNKSFFCLLIFPTSHLNKREHIFDWGLYVLNSLFTTHITFGLEFSAFKFQYSMDSFASFLYLLMLIDLLWFAYLFFCIYVFTNSFIIPRLVILFVRLYCCYIQDVFSKAIFA